MNRGIITISETGVVTVPTAPVWMTQFEIADLFGYSRTTSARRYEQSTRTRN